MSREQGQGLVEAVAALPLCIACALAIVDCGVILRDRIAVTQAATRAAEAVIGGGDAVRVAEDGLPRSLRTSADVQVSHGRVRVSAASRPGLLRMVREVEHSSTVVIAAGGAL